MAAGKERAQRETGTAASAPPCRAIFAFQAPSEEAGPKLPTPGHFCLCGGEERRGWAVGREGTRTSQGHQGAVYPGQNAARRAGLGPASRTCSPEVCVGGAKSKGLGCWNLALASRGLPAGLGPAGQSHMATPGHGKRGVQPASPRHARGTTLWGSGRGKRDGRVRGGDSLAWGEEDGEESGKHHRTCPSQELSPRGQP